STIWNNARTRLEQATRLVICGYSFPDTDTHAFELIETFLTVGREKEIELIDPYPAGIAERLNKRINGRCKLEIVTKTLRDYLGVPVGERVPRRTADKGEFATLKESKLR